MKHFTLLPAAAILAALLLGCAPAEEEGTPPAPEENGDSAAVTSADTVMATTDGEAAYPLTTCVVSDETLGDMGDPFLLTHDDREVRLCCKGCLEDFEADPARFLAKLDASSPVTATE